MEQIGPVALTMQTERHPAVWTRDRLDALDARRFLGGCTRQMRFCATSIVVALATSTLPMTVQAGQGQARFQVSLRILPHQPAPRVEVQDVSATSPGFPPYRLLKTGVKHGARPGGRFILLETEF